MKIFTPLFALTAATVVVVTPVVAQNDSASPVVASSPVAAPPPAGQPSQAEMMKQMMELAKTNENHKLLADTAGNWNYSVKMWMNPDPGAKPQESKGSATRKVLMDGRYVYGDYTGKMEMPGPDGKPVAKTFHGVGIEGYDNVKKKFVSSWMDSMGTGIEQFEGSYDAATKTFSYTGEVEPFPGGKEQVRETLAVPDKNHMTLQWFENHGGQEKMTLEINYVRAGKSS